MRLRVVCGLGDTIATLRPTSVFTSVDLPAFGRPTIATNPDLKAMTQELYAKPHAEVRPSSNRRIPPRDLVLRLVGCGGNQLELKRLLSIFFDLHRFTDFLEGLQELGIFVCPFFDLLPRESGVVAGGNAAHRECAVLVGCRRLISLGILSESRIRHE